MAIGVWSVPPDVLLERYGVSASHRVLRPGLQVSSPPSRGASRGHSASSVRSFTLAPPATAPLAGGRNRPGSLSAGSLENPVGQRCSTATGSGAGDVFPYAFSPLEFPEVQVNESRRSPSKGGMLSVGELRAIVLAPDNSKSSDGAAPLPTQAAQISVKPPSKESATAGVGDKRGRRGRDISPDGYRRRDTAEAQKCKNVRKAAADEERRGHRLQPPQPRRHHKVVNRGTVWSEGQGAERSVFFEKGAVPGNGRDEMEEDDDFPDDCSDRDSQDGVEAQGNPSKARHKNQNRSNPFVEYEDREMRLNKERRWLKDDDVYMRERMKGMRVDAVQSKLNKGSIPDDKLYEDAVYFGPYSKSVKTRRQQKAFRADGLNLPPMGKSLTGETMNMEAEPHAANKKRSGEKARKQGQAQAVISMQKMRALLQDSGKNVEMNTAS